MEDINQGTGRIVLEPFGYQGQDESGALYIISSMSRQVSPAQTMKPPIRFQGEADKPRLLGTTMDDYGSLVQLSA